jgi:aryl-alcohol dehydrogenase-like predicted oxidoreductase
VESNVKCLDWNLTAEEMDMLDAAIREKLAD